MTDFEFDCPKCKKKLPINQPTIVGDAYGHISEIHECGKGYFGFILSSDMLTPDEEKLIRETLETIPRRYKNSSTYCNDMHKLLAEIDDLRTWIEVHELACKQERDQLRENLDVATEALKIVTMHDPYEYDDKTCAGFMTVVYDNAKKALSKIGSKNADT